MQIQIMSKNYNVSDKLKNIITEKVNRLDRYFPETAQAKVVCSRVNKDLFMSDNMYQNIDLALPKVERQIKKYSTKLQDKLRKNVDLNELMFNDDDLDFEMKPDESLVDKVKNFNIYPLTVAEAIMELENSDHAFYVYLNADNGRVNIIYKRRYGGYGVIDPTIEQ